jgi:hypothetical protein
MVPSPIKKIQKNTKKTKSTFDVGERGMLIACSEDDCYISLGSK